jgi:hypothetical protein
VFDALIPADQMLLLAEQRPPAAGDTAAAVADGSFACAATRLSELRVYDALTNCKQFEIVRNAAE